MQHIITVDLEKLAQGAVTHMTSEDDLNWSLAAALYEMLSVEQGALVEKLMLDGYAALNEGANDE